MVSFIPFFLKKIFIRVQLIYNGVLVSGIQQIDSVIHMHIFIPLQILSHLGYHKILSRVPCVVQQALAGYLFHMQWYSATSVVSDSATLWTVAGQAPLSVGFSSEEYWNGLLCPPPGDLPHPGTEPASLMSPALAGGFSTPSATCLCVLIPSSSFIPPQPYISPLVSISLCLKSVSLFLFCI